LKKHVVRSTTCPFFYTMSSKELLTWGLAHTNPDDLKSACERAKQWVSPYLISLKGLISILVLIVT
jgi:hypothetical protein